VDSDVLFLLAFSSIGTATGVYVVNDKLERMLNVDRLPPLRWLAWLLAALGVVLALAALLAL
jgi:hypothetical protein